MPDTLEKDATQDEKKLEKWWKDAPRWQKAGVFIAGGALIVAILMYWRSRNQGQTATDTSSAVTPVTPETASTGTYSPVESAGYGDIWPSLGNLPSTATYTTPGIDYATTGLTPTDTSSFSSSAPTDNSGQPWSSPGTTSADILTQQQQQQANAILSAPAAGPSGLNLGLVETPAQGSIWDQMFGNNNTVATTDANNHAASSSSGSPPLPPTFIPTTAVGTGWNLPVTPPAPVQSRPSPAANTQQHVTASSSSNNLRSGSFRL